MPVNKFTHKAGRCAASLALAFSALAASADEPEIDASLAQGKICMPVAAVGTGKTPAHRFLSDVYRAVGGTKISNYVLKHDFSRTAKVCVNPAHRVDRERRGTVVIHESRHGKQHKSAYYRGADKLNARGAERVLLEWGAEADARLITVIFAHEKKVAGDHSYWEKLWSNDGYWPMLKAYEDRLEQDPADIRAAMRTAFLTFLRMPEMKESYADHAVEEMEKKGVRFDPRRKVDILLDDARLKALGDVGPYGNYMDAETMKIFRAAFTDQDYSRLLSVRQERGGHSCAP